jgi:uncharacterized protein
MLNGNRITWIQTYSGKKLDFENPTTDMIDLQDIEAGLEGLQRFAGQLGDRYTVADHSINLAELIPWQEPAAKLAALMHDAAEAYMMDIPSPLKNIMGGRYAHLEFKLQRVIAEKFDMQYPWVPWGAEIADYDKAICAAEAERYFMHKPIDNWHEHVSDIKVPTSHVDKHKEGTWLSLVEDTLKLRG